MHERKRPGNGACSASAPCSVRCFEFEVRSRRAEQRNPATIPSKALGCRRGWNAGTGDDTDPFIRRTPTLPRTRTARDATHIETEIIEHIALYCEMMNTVRRDYPIRPSAFSDARGPHLRTSPNTHGLLRPEAAAQMAHQLQSRGAPPRSSVHTIDHPSSPPPFPSSASPSPAICITAIT